ncbi:hypothetical protein EJD97_016637 [Solanum chilense]|uniref:Uncharacterized protein n=1 Tax=Solanum chilense TaxID=4083 RepID=A0A6N2B5F2_SOLCI|nr:hypothetical protein EJD97_016637 [Solanum chilense]
MDPAATEEVEKQSFESGCQGDVLKENDDEEIVFGNEDEDDDYEEDIDKEDVALEDDILEGARYSYEQSNSDKIWPADSNHELLLEHKKNNVKEEEEGIEDELSRVEDCNLKSTQNDVAITKVANRTMMALMATERSSCTWMI